MNHNPKLTSINGKPAEWNDEIRALWAQCVAAHFDGETRPTVSANYFTPRPYVDQYNKGSDRSGFVYTVGRDVCYHYFAVGSKVAQLPAENVNIGNLLYRQGDSVRSDCGIARAGYYPEWSKERPWVTYVRGTAGQHFPTVRGALAHLEGIGYKFNNVTLKREPT